VKRLALVLIASVGAHLMPAAASAAQPWQAVTLPQAEQRLLHSTHTDRDYRIFVSRPQHEPPPGGYPVLYVLDGNALFPSLAIQAQALEARPDPNLRNSVLIVGIGYPGEGLYDFKARAEDYTPDAEDRQRLPGREPPPYGGAERFLAFIETELKPMIATRYPVDPARQTLFGHSYGGLFTLYTLLNRPQAFSGYAAASPSIWWYQGYIGRSLAAFEKKVEQHLVQARLLVTAGSAEEPAADDPLTDPRQRHMAERRMVGNARDLTERLSSVPGLPVDLRINEGANHGTNAQYSTVQALELATSTGVPATTKAGD